MTIQIVMLVSLGFLLACMLALALTPAFRHRAERLASERVRRSLPVTLEEIRADKDRLRAEHAVTVHRLETQVDEARLNAARQMVEMNRKDARICALEEELDRVRGDMEENVNARRVLEHNLSERLPRVMKRLDAAHKLLDQRDLQIETLNTGAQKGIRALDEAMMLNAQQRSEIDRLRTTLATRTAARFTDEGSRSEAETALRSELEALRTRTRDQANVITRLQDLLSKYGGEKAAQAATDTSVSPDVELLRKDLAEARETLQLARLDTNDIASAISPGSAGDLRALRDKVQDQETVIKRLRAALETYEAEEASGGSSKWNTLQASRLSAKAKIKSLQAQVSSQEETIQRLRSEVASGNERLALQAAQFRDEMRRIGAGTRPTTADLRRPQQPARRASLVERIGQVGKGEVVTLPRAAATSGNGPATSTANSTTPSSPETKSEPAKSGQTKDPKVQEFKNALTAPDEANAAKPATSEGKASRARSSAVSASTPAEDDAKEPAQAEKPGKPRGKSRLMDRIAGITRT